MVSVSVCMIVKNEEAVLARCLDSLAGIADEIVIVDTGSTDRTKEIAAGYTDKLFDFVWCNDFSAARNFAFSKATKEYIYSADADEVLDEVNRQRMLALKQVLLPEIEIVQMIYVNPDDCNMVYNYTRELRPKLFKRLRSFRWIDPIHETIALDPLVYDSEIEILHLPQQLHSKRDFSALKAAWERPEGLTSRLYSMYAKELFISGTKEDFLNAEPVFSARFLAQGISEEQREEALCVLAKTAALCEDDERLLSVCLTELAGGTKLAAELYFLLAEYAEKKDKLQEAYEWYRRTLEAENYVCLSYGGEKALERLIIVCKKLERIAEAKEYEAYLCQLRGDKEEEGSQ